MASQSNGRVRRAAWQYLQSLHRAGVTELPIVNKAIPETIEPPTSTFIAELGNSNTPDCKVGSTQPLRVSAGVEQVTTSKPEINSGKSTSLFGGLEPMPQESPRLTEFQPSTMPRSERERQLKNLAEQVAGCTRCQELASTRTQTVFGVGNPEARIMFIGEAPGADEDRQGEPFVGRAGQLLNQIIEASRLKREEIYICNILRCRPPGNRTPAPEEAANCREYLDGQIEIIDPEYIVCWGAVAAQNLLSTKVSTGKLRGEFHSYRRAKVLCTYHPAYLLRNPDAKKHVWQDMKFLMRDMSVDLDKK